MMAHTLLVGAEGCAETQGCDWIREATPEAAEAYKVVPEYTVDGTGRPYFLMTVLDNAPPEVLAHVKKFRRVLRVTP
jgi:hypothetical protein